MHKKNILQSLDRSVMTWFKMKIKLKNHNYAIYNAVSLIKINIFIQKQEKNYRSNTNGSECISYTHK